jgi:phenylpropionate dioxygenase-like ring-hydroxylating dioxygenase large terminal subunit
VITNAWFVAGMSSDFQTGALHGATIAGKPLVMWRTREGEVVAFDGRCRHKRFPLADGKLLENDVLECAYHGFCYDATGACTSIPAKGDEGEAPKTAQLRRYPVAQHDGLVWIWPGDPERAGEVIVPPSPEINDDRWDTVSSGALEVACNYRLTIENLLDITHFYPLHAKNIGDYANSQIPVKIEREEVGGSTNYALPPMMRDWFGYDTVDRHHTHQMMSPGATRVELRVAPPGGLGTQDEKGYVLYHFTTPVDNTHHQWRWVMNCQSRWPHPQNPHKRLVDKVVEGFPSVVEEDRWALEKQHQMMQYPDDDYAEVHIKTDGAVVIVRRILERLELQEPNPDHTEIARLRTGRVAADTPTMQAAQ